jgi:hypothetical protein
MSSRLFRHNHRKAALSMPDEMSRLDFAVIAVSIAGAVLSPSVVQVLGASKKT